MAIRDASAPRAAMRRICFSRSVSGLGPRITDSWARAGSTTRRPVWILRIASASSGGGVSLTRKPDAPASSARERYPGRPKVVTMRLRQFVSAAEICSAVHRPSPSGISMSSRATSIPPAATAAAARRPVPTWATTSRSCSRSSRVARAPRTSAWSSAIRMRMAQAPCELPLAAALRPRVRPPVGSLIGRPPVRFPDRGTPGTRRRGSRGRSGPGSSR